MDLRAKQPPSKGTPDHFIGDVSIDRLAGGDPLSRLRVNAVRFAPGARNAWHAHACGADAARGSWPSRSRPRRYVSWTMSSATSGPARLRAMASRRGRMRANRSS